MLFFIGFLLVLFTCHSAETLVEVSGLLTVHQEIDFHEMTEHLALWSRELNGTDSKLNVALARKQAAKFQFLASSVLRAASHSAGSSFTPPPPTPLPPCLPQPKACI